MLHFISHGIYLLLRLNIGKAEQTLIKTSSVLSLYTNICTGFLIVSVYHCMDLFGRVNSDTAQDEVSWKFMWLITNGKTILYLIT